VGPPLTEAGCSGAEIRDYLMVAYYDQMSQSEWADKIGVTPSSVSQNISSAKRKLRG